MSAYFMNFHVFGEIADFLLLKEPQRRLLVDVSTDIAHRQKPGQANGPESGQAKGKQSGQRRHANRTTFTILDEDLIETFLNTMAIGDLAEATGTFSQSNYVPHKTSYIDTTFVLIDFQKLKKANYSLLYRGNKIEPAQDSLLH